MRFDTLAQNFNIHMSSELLWIAFFGAFLIFTISAIVFSYHWHSYGTNKKVMGTVQVLYISVGLGLLLISLLLIQIP